MTTSGVAMKMQIDLSRYRRAPTPFTPPPLLDPVEHDILVEGYAAPSAVDREFTKFASYCWWPTKIVPLLYRHDPNRVAGEITEIRADDNGLYVKARVTDADAKRCNFFSVAATVLDYRIRENDGPPHALVINAKLDEVSLVLDPANVDARILQRWRAPATQQGYDLAAAGFRNVMRAIEQLQADLRRAPEPDIKLPLRARAPTPRRQHVEPHRATAFGELVSAIERNHPHAP